MNDSGIRLVRKRFKCIKCSGYESKLVHPASIRDSCSNCQGFLSEVTEKEFQLQKKKVNTSEIKSTKTFPVKPTKQHYRDHYGDSSNPDQELFSPNNGIFSSNNKDRPPSNNMSKKQNYSNKNVSNNNLRSSQNNYQNNTGNKSKINQKNRRYQSNDNHNNNDRRHTNQSNNNYGSNNNNLRRSQNNDITNYNNNNGNDNSRQNDSNGLHLDTIFRNIFNQDNIGGGARVRTRSLNPVIRMSNPNGVFIIRSNANPMPFPFGGNFFQDFFGEDNSNPIMQSRIVSMPVQIRVHRHNFDEDVFDPDFTSFGSTLNGFFRDNFASNFRSNLESAMFEHLRNVIQASFLEAESQRHKKTTKEALSSLKKFSMTEKYCKKSKNGKLEYPNCCICLSEIGKSQNTVLLPCGHMFHWNCCHSWLKDNNTCPVCRFELPCEK